MAPLMVTIMMALSSALAESEAVAEAWDPFVGGDGSSNSDGSGGSNTAIGEIRHRHRGYDRDQKCYR